MFERKNLGEELVSYIKKNLRKGYTLDSLKWALIRQGYSKIEVEKAMKRAEIDLAHEAPQLESKPLIQYEILEPKELATKRILEHKPLWKKLLQLWFE